MKGFELEDGLLRLRPSCVGAAHSLKLQGPKSVAVSDLRARDETATSSSASSTLSIGSVDRSGHLCKEQRLVCTGWTQVSIIHQDWHLASRWMFAYPNSKSEVFVSLVLLVWASW